MARSMHYGKSMVINDISTHPWYGKLIMIRGKCPSI